MKTHTGGPWEIGGAPGDGWKIAGNRKRIRLSMSVGGLEHCSFFHVLEIVIPTDFHIFERG